MGLINWIFDFYQHSRIEKVRDEVAQARAETLAFRNSSGGGDSQRIERAIGELALAVKTIQRIAVEKGMCTGVEFQAKLAQIDREDGREDGKAPI